MLDKIVTLIKDIQEYYDTIYVEWMKDYSGSELCNLRKKQVKDIRKDVEIYNEIVKYRAFLNEKTIITFPFQDKDWFDGTMTARVKAQNSIESKIDGYVRRNEKGEIPINKCLNDLFGIRIIIPTEMDCLAIREYVRICLPGYKVIDSSKGEYKAVHVYFMKSNMYFPWELQIWRECDVEINYASHETYKQEYTAWESRNEEVSR